MGLLYVKTAEGRKKPSIFVWLTLLVILLGISIALVYNPNKAGIDQVKDTEEKKAAPIQQGVSQGNLPDMDAATRKELEDQLERERRLNNGYIEPSREKEIRDKYQDLAKTRRTSNFQPSIAERFQRMYTGDDKKDEDQPLSQEADPGLEKTTTYKTLAERLAENEGGPQAIQNSKNGNIEFGKPPTFDQPNQQVDSTGRPIRTDGRAAKPSIKNILPLGTFIPCVLDGDVVTSQLQSYVWANVVLDVTFRRQLQLPKGLVKIRGTTAAEPVQNTVDIHFDTMLFSDGTELPISGYAYSAFDPRYPHRFRTRGVPGELIVPPMWVKAQAFIYTAALGASDAYIQNAINQDNQTTGNQTPIPFVDPVTGQISYGFNTQSNTSNQNIGKTLGLGAAQSGLGQLVETLLKDLEKYQPYVIVEKGSPLFIQLDETVDVDQRGINATALAKEQATRKNMELGIMPAAPVYAPGDARASYTGYDPSTGTPEIPNGAPNMSPGYRELPPATSGGGGAGNNPDMPSNAQLMQNLQQLTEMTTKLSSGQPTRTPNRTLTPEELQQSLLKP